MEVNMTQLQKHAITFVKGIKFIVHWDVYAQMVIIELMEYAVDAPIKEFTILTQKHAFVGMAQSYFMGLVYLYVKKMKLEFMEIVNVLMDTIILMEYVINVDQIATMIQHF